METKPFKGIEIYVRKPLSLPAGGLEVIQNMPGSRDVRPPTHIIVKQEIEGGTLLNWKKKQEALGNQILTRSDLDRHVEKQLNSGKR